jgi:serine/threonine protein phosphatase PrpC
MAASCCAAAVAKAAADKLVTKAMKEGTNDNVTALIMLFDWD